MATPRSDVSKLRKRWSAPVQPLRYSTLHGEAPTHPRNTHELATFQLDAAKHSGLTAAAIVEFGGGDSNATPSVQPSRQEPGQWSRSFVRVGPLVGLGALLVAFLQIFASFAVLKSSDGTPVRDWKFYPSVYIAILSTISNGAISLAAAEGAVITFWLRLLRGTTLAQLHRDFTYGTEFYDAIRCGRHVSPLALAGIFATFVCIDGTLLQRATSTQSVSYHGPVNLDISVVPEVPSYFSGYNNRFKNSAEFSPDMLRIVNQYSSKQPITSGILGCSGTCTATIRAPALVPYLCESNITWKNFSAPMPPRQPYRTMFESSLTSQYGSFETLDFYTHLTADEVATTCAGPVNSTHCYLRSAIAEYSVVVTNETITLQDPANPRFISWTNNTSLTPEAIHTHNLVLSERPRWIKTTLAGIVNAFYFEFNLLGWSYQPTPTKPDIWATHDALFRYKYTTNSEEFYSNKACGFIWKDVRSGAMAGLNELMFRIGVYVANNYDNASIKDKLDPGVVTKYTTTGMLHTPQEVFKSDFAFFFAAAGLELFTILLVLFTYRGYWELGRHVSFSPLETAKAFGAALLYSAASNSSGKEIASFMGDRDVRYGLLKSENEPDDETRTEGTLMISHEDDVRSPKNGYICL